MIYFSITHNTVFVRSPARGLWIKTHLCVAQTDCPYCGENQWLDAMKLPAL